MGGDGFFVEGHFFARHDRCADFGSRFATEAEFGQRRIPVFCIDRVDLLPLALCNGDGFDGRDGLRAFGGGRVFEGAGFVCGEVAPGGSGEQVARDVFAHSRGPVVESAGPLGRVRAGLGSVPFSS